MDMVFLPIGVLETFPDRWYNPYTLAIAGTASWVFSGLVIAYFVLKWLKNSEKFYAALAKQEAGQWGRVR